MHLHVRIDASEKLTKKRKQHPPPGDDASTAEAAPGRVGRHEQGEARRANDTPNGGPHFELGRLQIKTWYKSDFSIAETTWPTYLYIYLRTYYMTQTLTLKRRSALRQVDNPNA